MSKYDDIINLPHYEMRNHKRMSIEARSAQFAPFSALTGYEDEVRETARLTDKEISLTNDQKLIIDEKLRYIKDNKTKINMTYFVKDKNKSGGKYLKKEGIIIKIDFYNKYVIFEDKQKIDLNNIINIDII